MRFESKRILDSVCCPGVRFTLARITFGRRIELMRMVRELAGRLEFATAGTSVSDRVDAALLTNEIDELFLRWGLIEVTGLEIDGKAPDVTTLIADGPEELCREIASAIKRECFLSEQERKN